MTNTNYADLCERLRAREGGDWLAWQAADTIKAQAERIQALEAKCALLAASLAQEEKRSESATRFAGLVLIEHRNDGYPGDVDGDFLQQAALDCGLIEERTVGGPCGERCSCAETISESEFPTICYFNTEAGKTAINAAIAAQKEQPE